jgi:hypothetical protein
VTEFFSADIHAFGRGNLISISSKKCVKDFSDGEVSPGKAILDIIENVRAYV